MDMVIVNTTLKKRFGRILAGILRKATTVGELEMSSVLRFLDKYLKMYSDITLNAHESKLLISSLRLSLLQFE